MLLSKEELSLHSIILLSIFFIVLKDLSELLWKKIETNRALRMSSIKRHHEARLLSTRHSDRFLHS